MTYKHSKASFGIDARPCYQNVLQRWWARFRGCL